MFSFPRSCGRSPTDVRNLSSSSAVTFAAPNHNAQLSVVFIMRRTQKGPRPLHPGPWAPGPTEADVIRPELMIVVFPLGIGPIWIRRYRNIVHGHGSPVPGPTVKIGA